MSSELMGIVLPAITVRVSDRQSMNYAACTFDNNPWYFDDERPDGIVSPPMLVVSLTWPLSLEFADALHANGYGDAQKRQVHYTEYIRWHRPFRPGETLRISGRIAAVMKHRAGTLGVVAFEAVDADGLPVFDEFTGAMFRGVRFEGENEGTDFVSEFPERVEEAEPLWSTTLHVDPLASHLFDGCGDLHFPIHTSRKFAHQVGLPNPLLHGTCTESMAVRELVNRECGGDPTRLRATGCRFTGMVLPGTDITVRLVGVSETDTRNLFFDVLTADGKKAISEGFLSVV
ncbi:MAG: MaoC/PaaZ C-terminal domain-containing protein [FCB group bacterium]|jgi:acyl dehydratase|nr:MaoC/PaaZ C-terminal domain-containing protein [FCB group bacterium]